MPDNLSQNLPSRIGCHCWGTSDDSIDAQPTFAEVGCRWVRATRPMQMDTLTTGKPREFDFAKGGERGIDLAVDLGMSIMGILDGRWGNETGFNDLPFASPIWEHLDLWQDFVVQTVEHYKDRVKYWEIINEPPFFWWYPTPEGMKMPKDNPLTKRAPIWAYAKLLKASAEAIRATDKSAKVVVGSGFPDGLFLKKLYQLGAKDDFDIASCHYLNCKHPEDFGRGYRRLRAVMAEFGDAKKQLWDTENGPGGAVIGQSVQTPDEYEGLYNIYRHCFAYESGLDRYFWFNPVAANPGIGHTSSTRKPDGSLSAAYAAMKFLTASVGDGALIGAKHFADEAHAYVFNGPAGPVSIVWATAPAQARLTGGAIETHDHLGNPVKSSSEFPLTGKPLFFRGDVLKHLDVTVSGPRETVVAPMKKIDPDAKTFSSPRAPKSDKGSLGIEDPAWKSIPFVGRRDEIPASPEQQNHFCLLPTSTSADVQMAHDDEALYLRIRTYDDRLDAKHPTGLVQFTLRDQDPAVTEWSYFYNSYGLFNLYASPRGAMFLRYETMQPDVYPSGVQRDVPVEVRRENDGLTFTTRVPWSKLGPAKPGKNGPFYMMFAFGRCDNMIDLPAGDEPEEWSHNFADNFIVKKPALSRWVTFETK